MSRYDYSGHVHVRPRCTTELYEYQIDDLSWTEQPCAPQANDHGRSLLLYVRIGPDNGDGDKFANPLSYKSPAGADNVLGALRESTSYKHTTHVHGSEKTHLHCDDDHDRTSQLQNCIATINASIASAPSISFTHRLRCDDQAKLLAAASIFGMDAARLRQAAIRLIFKGRNSLLRAKLRLLGERMKFKSGNRDHRAILLRPALGDSTLDVTPQLRRPISGTGEDNNLTAYFYAFRHEKQVAWWSQRHEHGYRSLHIPCRSIIRSLTNGQSQEIRSQVGEPV